MKNQTSSSYMRIRHYVIDFLAKTKGSVTRIPSNRELAERFGVSQPTVVRALQELIKDGYLVNRPGVGLFSNPGRIGTRESRIWGVVFGDGRWAYLSRDAFHFADRIGEELLERDNHNLLKLITMGETEQASGTFPELSMLAGICWWCPEAQMIPDILRISETVPVVVVGKNIPGLDCYYFDFEQENYEIARWMIDRGCRRLGMVMNEDLPQAIAGVRRACEEAGLAFPPGYVLGADLEAEQELDRMVSLGCAPDGLIFNCKAVGFPNAIKRHPEMENCLIASDPLWVDRKWEFDGLLVSKHFEAIAGEVADLLEQGVRDMPRIARRFPISHEIVAKHIIENNRRMKHEPKSLHID